MGAEGEDTLDRRISLGNGGRGRGLGGEAGSNEGTEQGAEKEPQGCVSCQLMAAVSGQRTPGCLLPESKPGQSNFLFPFSLTCAGTTCVQVDHRMGVRG